MFRMSPGSAPHSAAGRGILAKMKGPFPASIPTIPLALAKSRCSLAGVP